MNYLIQLARKKRKDTPANRKRAEFRKQFGNEWWQGPEGEARRKEIKEIQNQNRSKPKKPKGQASGKTPAKPRTSRTRTPAKPVGMMTKVGNFAKGRYGYGTLAGLGGLAVGGAIGRMSRKKEE